MESETKKCRACCVDIPVKATVCPNCKKSQVSPVRRAFNIIAGLFVLFLVLPTFCTVMNQSKNSITAQSRKQSDFKINQINWHTRDGYVFVTGSVNNVGDSPSGVHLKVTTYGKDGSILNAKDFWPASVKNIPPGKSFPFEYMFEQTGNPKKLNCEVIDSRSW